jgi:hypothetical protein
VIIYKTLIKPVLIYGAEAWVLSNADEARLGDFERKILRRICGPLCEEATWRSRHNEELYRLYDEIDLVTAIRISRHRWAGHIVRINVRKSPWISRRIEGEWGGQTSDGWME